MVTEEGSYLRLVDVCITQLEAQGPSWTCTGSKDEEKKQRRVLRRAEAYRAQSAVTLQGIHLVWRLLPREEGTTTAPPSQDHHRALCTQRHGPTVGS